MRARSSWGTVAAVAGGLMLGIMAWQRRHMDDLAGEVALVTGGSRGLGFLIARELGRNGCRVAICARDPQELAAAQADLWQEGIDIFPMQCDLRDPYAIAAMVDAVTAHYGRIDILVNNAGIIQVGPQEQMTTAHFTEAMDIIFWGTYHTTQAVLPQMQARRHGRIVNITSIGGTVSVPHLLPYSTAKFATVGYSQGLREALHHQGITVTTVAPSTLRTGSHLQAQVTGRHVPEYTWFGLSATLPGISTSAENAARQVVQATKRRAAFHYVGWPARIAGRLHGLLPGITADLLGLITTYGLPDAPAGSSPTKRGMVVDRELSPMQQRVLHLLMGLGQQAAQRYHQYAGEENSVY
ncbi:MAG: SDR family NAD(P)-dependent oxidoreductase [Caldilineaceae bacterium]|nr:SDR family NAD(P)-dependent oxidoreductase [Caldilineaceae bacterium]